MVMYALTERGHTLVEAHAGMSRNPTARGR
jgi:hypothetical protein